MCRLSFILISAVVFLIAAGFGTVARGDTQSEAAPSRIERLKKIFPRTPLVVDGKAAAFIAPGGSTELMQLAEELRDTFRQRMNVTFDIIPANQLVSEEWEIDLNRIGSSNVIALGNVNDNMLIRALYGELYVVADSIYPGKGGYVVRTVHDPFAVGINVLALAGSDAEGVRSAIEVFLKEFAPESGDDLIIEEPVIRVEFEKKAYRFFPDQADSLTSKRQPQYTGIGWFQDRLRESGFMDDAGNIIENTRSGQNLVGLTGLLARMGQTYFRTGNKELLPLMKQLVQRNLHLLDKKAELNEMGARAAGSVHEWDLLEELPIWTDDERLAITNALLSDALIGHERRAFHNQVRDGAKQALDENHGTNSALNSFQAWHYFHKYYDVPESDYWMRCAQAVFSAQASTFQILEDASGYLCYCPKQTMSYALESRDMTYFSRGIARHHAKYVSLACVNNLGFLTGFGDTADLVSPEAFELIAPAAWYYRDPHLNWIIQNWLPQSSGLRVFQSSIAVDLDVEPVRPDEWTGVIRWPLYEAPLAKGDATDKPVFAPEKDLGFSLFNKIIFKEDWSQDGQYLLLDGAGVWDGPGPHGHKHNDINTIINFTALGRMWLVDHTYQVRSYEDHSSVVLMREGKDGYAKRTLATLLDLAEDETFGMSRSSFMSGEKCIFWKKGSYFLLLDRVTAKEDGEHFARAAFRTLGKAKLEGPDLYLSQTARKQPSDVRFCKIASDKGAILDLEDYPFTSTHWESFYPYAETNCNVLHQDKKRYLKKGESITFMNLLYPYREAQDASAVSMESVSETCALVSESGQSGTLIGIGEIPGGMGNCSMFIISPQRVFLAGAQTLSDGVIRSDHPCNLSIDLTQKSILVDSREKVNLAFGKQPQGAMLDGKAAKFEKQDGSWRIALDAGKSTLTMDEWDGFGRISELVDSALSQSQEMAAKRADLTTQIASEKLPEKSISVRQLIPNVSVETILASDINGDGQSELLLGTDNGLSVHKADGTGLWEFETGAPVRAIDAGDVNADGRMEITLGCDDEHVYLLDNSGHELWKYRCKPSEGSITGPPVVDFVKIDDLEGDGQKEVIAGANWIHVLKADGEVKWEHYMEFRRGNIVGDFVCGAVADVDGDGRKEVLGSFITSYPKIQILDAEGKLHENLLSARVGQNIDVPIDMAIVTLPGGEQPKYIVSLDSSKIGVFLRDQKPREEAGGMNNNRFVKMAVYQPDAGKPPTIAAGTSTCDLFRISAKPVGQSRNIKVGANWLANLGEKITALLIKDMDSDGHLELYAGTKEGSIYAFDLENGTEIGHKTVFDAPVSTIVRSGKDILIAGRGVWYISER